jgi:hypothetical protein
MLAEAAVVGVEAVCSETSDWPTLCRKLPTNVQQAAEGGP